MRAGFEGWCLCVCVCARICAADVSLVYCHIYQFSVWRSVNSVEEGVTKAKTFMAGSLLSVGMESYGLPLAHFGIAALVTAGGAEKTNELGVWG